MLGRVAVSYLRSRLKAAKKPRRRARACPSESHQHNPTHLPLLCLLPVVSVGAVRPGLLCLALAIPGSGGEGSAQPPSSRVRPMFLASPAVYRAPSSTGIQNVFPGGPTPAPWSSPGRQRGRSPQVPGARSPSSGGRASQRPCEAALITVDVNRARDVPPQRWLLTPKLSRFTSMPLTKVQRTLRKPSQKSCFRQGFIAFARVIVFLSR